MSDYLSNMAQLAKRSPNVQSPYHFIFMKVSKIISDGPNSALTFAYGIDILTKENVAVRLSSIDETASDLVHEKKIKTMQLAKENVTKQYQGRNSRETLQEKRDKRHATYLAFEKCVALPSPPEPSHYTYYRSHWSKTITAYTENIEFYVGMANITCVDEREMKQGSGKIRAAATVIEYIRPLVHGQNDKNYSKITHALRNQSKELLREGCTKLSLYKDGKEIHSMVIKQAQIVQNGTNSYGQTCEYSIPAPIEQTIEKFLAPHDKMNEYAVLKDIGRIIFHVFCGTPIDSKHFSSQDNEYLQELRNLLKDLQSGACQVKAIGMRVLRFGNESINHLLPNGRYDPLLIFKRQLKDDAGQYTGVVLDTYVPTIFGLLKGQHNRRFIIFHERISYVPDVTRSCTLDEISDTLNDFEPKLIDPASL